jgi:hypothetical protein
MDGVSSSKFSFSLILAILFHLLLLTVFVLTLNTDKNKPRPTAPIEALQATVFDEQQLEKQMAEARFLTQVPKHKLTRAEKRRLAREKKAALRLAAKRQKQLPPLAKLAPAATTATAEKNIPLLTTDKPAPSASEKQAAAQAKKALARERWLKKVAARKKAQQAQLKKPNVAAVEPKSHQENRLPQTSPSPF